MRKIEGGGSEGGKAGSKKRKGGADAAAATKSAERQRLRATNGSRVITAKVWHARGTATPAAQQNAHTQAKTMESGERRTLNLSTTSSSTIEIVSVYARLLCVGKSAAFA